jgi:biopolymer transport protein ExbB
MNAGLIQTVISAITANIFPIIWAFVLVETVLVITIIVLMKRHEGRLVDIADNLIKGFPDAPDKDSTQNVHEKIQAILQFVRNKIVSNFEFKTQFKQNVSKLHERPIYGRHYNIEICASIMSTLVQVFPLLGILGTILAIAQTAVPGAQIDSTALSKAFVLAMDTTILGILFSILFMVIESALHPKIERVISESKEYREILSSLYLS